MIRLFHVYFPGRTLMLALSECVLSSLALLAAMWLWFGRDVDLTLRYDHGLLRVTFAPLVCMLCMYYYDLYDSFVIRAFRELITRMVHVLGTVCIVLAVVYYGYPPLELSRGPLAIWLVLGGVSLLLWRRWFVSVSVSTQLGTRSILLGDGPLAVQLVEEIATRPEFGVNLVGYIGAEGASSGSLTGLRHLGTFNELLPVVQREDIQSIVVSMEDRRGQLPLEALLGLKTHGVRIEQAPDLYEALTGKVPVSTLRLSWLLFSPGFRISKWTLLYKRTASIVFSLLGLLIAAPVMLLVAIAIRLDSPGPAIFRQKRIGKDGKPFTLYKFRSMHMNSDPQRPAERNDARITRVGFWLRRCRLDELPQLVNILIGDMYLIGPRPFTPSAEEEYARDIPFYSQRWTTKPGATGWAQIKGGYCSSLAENTEKLGYDLFYIKHISVGLDCLIVFHTIKILLLGRGAR